MSIARINNGILTYNGALGQYISPLEYDPDAQAFFDAAGITDDTQKGAVDTLVIGLKADSLWDKIIALYPIVGGTVTTHKYNLKNPQDTDAAHRLYWAGGWTHSSTGAQPNGSNTYADTYLDYLTGPLTTDDSHLTFYSRTNTSTLGRTVMGATKGGGTLPYYSLNLKEADDLTRAYQYAAGLWVEITDTDTRGFYISSRVSNVDLKLFKNGSQVGVTCTLNQTRTLNTQSMFISANHYKSFHTGLAFSDIEWSFVSIGDGLTTADASNLNTLVQAFQTTLGRNV